MDEAARTACLRDLALDRIKQPEVFEKITHLAAETLACSIAAISVVDQERVWFLAKTGFNHITFARGQSFCSICYEDDTPLIVADAATDARLARASTLHDALSARSYVGAPLRIEGANGIGVLWCASPEIEAFEPDDLARLTTLAQLAEQCLNAHAKTLALARANASLGKLNHLFRQAEAAAQIGSWRVDLTTDELHWSDQVFAIHGVPVGTPVDVKSAVQFYEPQDRIMVEETLDRVLETGEPLAFEATIRRQDGETRRIRSMGERIDVDGVPESLAGVFIDCTEEHLRNIALQRAATRDPLTGLYNRSEFDRRLVEALSDRRRSGPDCPITVMLIDLDGFKDVNDHLGHLVGDRLLVQIAQSLDSAIDGNGFLARWGGDEFALLFPVGCTTEEVMNSAQKLIADISEQITVGGTIIHVSATCGFAEMRDGAAGEELVRRADLALYHGKANGRGGVHGWSAQIETVQATRQTAIARLTSALDNGQAFAAYQPIVALQDQGVVGVEALLRLRDGSGRVVTASEFAPALLDPRLARRVSRFIINQVVAEASKLLALFGPDCQIGINVSEADLSQGDFLELIEDAVKQSDLSPANIVLEVTETMLLLDESRCIRDLLTALDQRGFEIALDDFGTGFSSLTHLRDFPIRKVKIDKDFIATMAHDHQSRLIVQAMVQMGRSLEIDMVAEGVETEDQRVFLRSIGCGYAQGFKFARPGSLEDLRAQFGEPRAPEVGSQLSAA
ncbi:MAG: EAL domain-containing protein [Pseudomonadota bacterium]